MTSTTLALAIVAKWSVTDGMHNSVAQDVGGLSMAILRVRIATRWTFRR